MAGNNGTYEGNVTLGVASLLNEEGNTAVSLNDITGKVNMGHVTDFDNLGVTGYTIRIAEEFAE